ncbi:aminoglycoside phosphotransferase family protein [Enterococcus rivorum]|uniref:Aminoglycoside phosphotransferase domain-containing protein n=1 Tax=Enterococcus rivorum TaxID=762845 RepID=A0A1E5KU87_9ENTE|nr:phosphotransferase [Enterococcus rivorum]MBP2098946.1 thiamine kinase-like enzyme [Enterococcus rivorum]OEH81457.1 hypothetical protein BCR26_04210 [Enterococcus rivorum]
MINEFICKKKYGEVTSIRKMNGAGPNISWLIATDENKKVILQKNSLPLSHLTLIDEIMGILFEQGIPISPFLNIEAGSNLDCVWIIKTFVDGRNCDLSILNDIKQASNVLKRIHSIPIDNMNNNYYYLSPHDPIHWLVNSEDKINNFFRSIGNDNNYIKLIKYCEESIGNMSLHDYKKLPHSIVHGDFHGGNIIFKKKYLEQIIDFDTLCVSPRIHDLSYSWFLLCRKERGGFNVNVEYSKMFFNNYFKNNQLSILEKKFFKHVLILRLIPTSDYLFQLKKSKPAFFKKYLSWTIRALESVSEFFYSFIN